MESEKKKQSSREIRFYVSPQMYDWIKKDSEIYGQPMASFARHIFSVAYVDFRKEHSSGDEDLQK
jgi:hypothetical protein